jgi:hypothetical protein
MAKAAPKASMSATMTKLQGERNKTQGRKASEYYIPGSKCIERKKDGQSD